MEVTRETVHRTTLWSALVWCGLLAGCLTLLKVKFTPLLILLASMGAIAALQFTPWKRLARVGYLLAVGLLFLQAWTAAFALFDSWWFPDRGQVMVEGEVFTVMDHSWLWEFGLGVMAAILSLVLYARKATRQTNFARWTSVVLVGLIGGILVWKFV